MDLSPDEDNFQGRLLHQAALWDNVELLEELLSCGADVDARDGHARCALHAAALADRSRCLVALCHAGATLDAHSDLETHSKTALHIAAERGHVHNVRTLVAAGASLDVLDARGDTPLALAERGRHRHVASALREHADALERERLSQHAQLRELVSRGETHQLRTKLSQLGAEAGLVANLTPGGANTLLYVASESGSSAAVGALLEAGCDGRAHPVTNYCPLYIATYHGHLEIARLLLRHFPQAVQQETVEKWLPLHAACIGGHAPLVTLLMQYPYPESLLNTYTECSGRWRYRFAFDVNACDASGQSALYVACTLGNLAVVDALLSHAVHAVHADPPPPPPLPQGDKSEDQTKPASQQVVSPHRAGISLGIHAIVSKLTGSTNGNNESSEVAQMVHPVRCDVGRAGDSCLAAAVRGGHERIVRRLLAAGAHPDSPALPPNNDHQLQFSEVERRARPRSRSAAPALGMSSPSPSRVSCTGDRDGGWTALALAAHRRDVRIAELLVSRGAGDPSGRALRECARHALHDLLAALLATKAYPDPEYKVNKSAVSERVFGARERDASLTYSALCPATPVLLNWRDLRCHLSDLRMCWVRGACLRVNSKLSDGASALHALTRLDVSNNELRVLPPDLFCLLSLRYLNAAQNKLERLPTEEDPFEEELDSKGRPKKSVKKTRPQLYTAPVLQELYLQDNRLEELPGSLFSLPALSTLDVSNNKLRVLPAELWSAPALRDLNAALNHLRDLPPPHHHEEECGSPVPATSPTDATSPSVSGSQQDLTTNSWLLRSSVERSDSEAQSDVDDEPPIVEKRSGNTICTEARRVHAWRGVVETVDTVTGGGCPLSALNLSHNQLTCVPAALACCAPRLARLNMAYNSLRSMSFVTSYPPGLRQLDLSHNEITCWPSLPQVERLGSSEGDPLSCYCAGGRGSRGKGSRGGSARARLLAAACPARRHLRLDSLRTLILSNNMLTRIQLTTDDDGWSDTAQEAAADSDDEWGNGSGLKSRLLFPLLSMLDVSCNMLRNIPAHIHELTNLSVLNISGNKDVTDLPPQMGLLSRLWNLNTAGCSLQEPLRSMVASGRYKSMDVVGYLKSVLQEARPYARMKLMLVGLQGIGKTSLLECLRQESAMQHRRKPTDHWSKRMGNKSPRRGNISTVGVDIGTWVYEKYRSTRGPVTFRTWDFGGQQEYYATHQYFLSRRSLYLVLWRATDGRKGLAGALDWLRSIQARAPGSPVILVATHYDQIDHANLPESESPEVLQRLIRTTIMGAPDADKLGLPRVVDSIEVSCSTRHNVRLLADIIYSVAFSVKPPGSKEPLLEQRVPASYVALEDVVTALAHDLKEPVLRHEDYKRLVSQYMQQKNYRQFRDAAELRQATMFLHDNGVLLHYDDATLKELYFLRPQWLCDVLAHVVTVREINPFATNGIMKMEELSLVLKASPELSRGEEASALGVSLLNKFELALCWDARLLLVPPLLPTREPAAPQLPLRSRGFSSSGRGTPRRTWPSALAPLADPARATDSPTLIQECGSNIEIVGRESGHPLRRLLLLSYVPRGFWPRLCTRLLADDAVPQAANNLYSLSAEMELDEVTSKALELNWAWKLWKTGLKLVCGELLLLSLRESGPQGDPLLGPCGAGDEHFSDEPYSNLRLRVRQEGLWSELDVSASSCVEILLPAQVCVARREDGLPISGYQSISLEPNPETLAKVLAMVSEHVDLLLEDWYPSLGTRFVHTSEGRCLITRLVPCHSCLRDATPHQQHNLAQALRRLEVGLEPRPRVSEESRMSDGDSGVGNESTASSRLGSVEGVIGCGPGVGGAGGVGVSQVCVAHAWTVEECILAACSSHVLRCPSHAHLTLRDVAPDLLLLDVEECKRARWEHISRLSIAGRGAFGTVLSAIWRRPGTEGGVPVALKALQPVPPPNAHDLVAQQAYKAALSRWERDPSAGACRAYCGLRQELSIVSALRHPHVLTLRAVCAAPLALLLELAPMGALDCVLRTYRGCGVRVGVRAARALALQLARALEYLHARRVLYRDLKSENVLVWQMPSPQEASAVEMSPVPINVLVKLGDYGISRLAPPSGTKGFGGTEGFMAPEIMRYNGEEEYNEKVDCFSFGMLLYEIVTLRQPFEGHEAVKEAVLEGARPPLSPTDVQYPCCVLETMRRCWSGAPALRPSAAALVSVAAAPEYVALADAAHALAPPSAAAYALTVRHRTDEESTSEGWEIWYGGGEPEKVHTLLATPTAFTQHHSIRIPPDKSEPVTVTAICRVGDTVWVGDSVGRVSFYNASSCSLVRCVCVSGAVGDAAVAVTALQPLAGLGRVALALRSGRLFLVCSEPVEAEGSFVQTELGAATDLCCLAAVPTDTGWEVWAGGDVLYAYGVGPGGVTSAEVLVTERVTLLASAGSYVIAYYEPGVCVYQWSVGEKVVRGRLDCSKLVPCSESLQSIAIDEHLAPDRCKVTALCCLGAEVYVGTAWGCVIVADDALRPLTVFRPYEDEVRAMIPLIPHRGTPGGAMLATLGGGYRPLLQRYAPAQSTSQSTYGGSYCLLWRATRWLPD